MDANFRDAVEVLNHLEVKYWLSAGSLLGILRDNQLIPWDHDVDVCVLEDDLHLLPLGRALRNAGFQLIYTNGSTFHFSRKGGRTLDVSVVRLIGVGGKTMYANVWDGDNGNSSLASARTRFYSALTHRMARAFSESHVFLLCMQIRIAMQFRHILDAVARPGKVAYLVPREFLTEIVERDFHGVIVRVPKMGQQVLKSIYGDNWRIPVKSTTWQEFTQSI